MQATTRKQGKGHIVVTSSERWQWRAVIGSKTLKQDGGAHEQGIVASKFRKFAHCTVKAHCQRRTMAHRHSVSKFGRSTTKIIHTQEPTSLGYPRNPIDSKQQQQRQQPHSIDEQRKSTGY